MIGRGPEEEVGVSDLLEGSLRSSDAPWAFGTRSNRSSAAATRATPATTSRARSGARRARPAHGGRFEAVDIASDVIEQGDGSAARSAGARDVATVQAACRIVDQLFKAKWFDKIGYSRTWRTDNWIYHRVDEPLADPAKPAGASRGARCERAPRASAAPVAAPAVAAPRVDIYAPPSGVLGLTKDELRARALKIIPWRTAWIGRVDVIPPEADERTALIDRGLELRGLLTQPEIEEIHRVGDLWLEHKDVAGAARLVGLKSADEAIAELKRQRAALKEKKKREAAEKKRKRADEIAVAERKKTDIVFLGRGVSSRHHDRRPHVEKLEALGLPVLATPADVARALGLTVRELRWLAFHADAADKPHYVYFEVPKRSGGKRMLASPQKKLAAAQRWVLERVLEKLPLEDAAHGFVRARSTVSNALPHVGRDVVVNLDLSDFFPTITFARVRGLFQRMGYSPAAATVLALLVTECERREVTYAGQRYWVAVRDRALPQGACTSPALSNLVARKLDRRLRGVADKMGFVYTRYADDLDLLRAGGAPRRDRPLDGARPPRGDRGGLRAQPEEGARAAQGPPADGHGHRREHAARDPARRGAAPPRHPARGEDDGARGAEPRRNPELRSARARQARVPPHGRPGEGRAAALRPPGDRRRRWARGDRLKVRARRRVTFAESPSPLSRRVRRTTRVQLTTTSVSESC